MTAIFTVIGNGFTIHACDSLRNQALDNQGTITHHLIQMGSKTVKFSQFRGAMSVFGLMHLHGWDIIDWLEQQSIRAVEKKLQSPSHFANQIEHQLREIFFSHNVTQHSVGIHFTAYEWKNQMWTPELFFITNFRGIHGQTQHYIGGLEMAHQRQTFFSYSGETRYDFHNHGRAYIRAKISAYLMNGGFPFVYKNGDPSLFQNLDTEIFDHQLAQIPHGLPTDLDFSHAALAKVNSLALLHAARPDTTRRIGAPCHNLLIRPEGENLYESLTGLDLIPGA